MSVLTHGAHAKRGLRFVSLCVSFSATTRKKAAANRFSAALLHFKTGYFRKSTAFMRAFKDYSECSTISARPYFALFVLQRMTSYTKGIYLAPWTSHRLCMLGSI